MLPSGAFPGESPGSLSIPPQSNNRRIRGIGTRCVVASITPRKNETRAKPIDLALFRHLRQGDRAKKIFRSPLPRDSLSSLVISPTAMWLPPRAPLWRSDDPCPVCAKQFTFTVAIAMFTGITLTFWIPPVDTDRPAPIADATCTLARHPASPPLRSSPSPPHIVHSSIPRSTAPLQHTNF